MSASSIIESALDPFAQSLTPEAARRALEFRIDDATQARVDELARLAAIGQIDESQKWEYRELIEACDLVAILKSHARGVLSHAA